MISSKKHFNPDINAVQNGQWKWPYAILTTIVEF